MRGPCQSSALPAVPALLYKTLRGDGGVVSKFGAGGESAEVGGKGFKAPTPGIPLYISQASSGKAEKEWGGGGGGRHRIPPGRRGAKKQEANPRQLHSPGIQAHTRTDTHGFTLTSSKQPGQPPPCAAPAAACLSPRRRGGGGGGGGGQPFPPGWGPGYALLPS